MAASRREFIFSTSSTLLSIAIVKRGISAYGQRPSGTGPCTSTVDANCVVESANASASDFSDANSSDCGTVDDSPAALVTTDSNGNTTVTFTQPDVIESQIQGGVTQVNTACLNLGSLMDLIALGASAVAFIAGLITGTLTGVVEVATVVALIYGALGFSFNEAARDPASLQISYVRLYRPPSRPPIASASLSPLAAAFQLSGFHATSIILALNAFTTTHERYLGALQNVASKPAIQILPAVQAQASALGSNASACATLCSSLAADMQQISKLFASQPASVNATSTSPSKIAASLASAWPAQSAALQGTYKFGPNSLAAAGRIAKAIATSLPTMKTIQASGTSIVMSMPPTVAQFSQLASATGTSLLTASGYFSALAKAISSANWPPICPNGTPVGGQCVPLKGTNGKNNNN